jgi:3-isopropylmalate/(R)-2-methylmalate dehydratase small subunit
MGNRLLLVPLGRAEVDALIALSQQPDPPPLVIDVEAMTVRCAGLAAMPFPISPRHRRMFLEGMDVIGLTLSDRAAIDEFARRHWAAQPWLQDVAGKMKGAGQA